MTREELEAIRQRAATDNSMGVLVDRRQLLEAYNVHILAFKAIVHAAMNGCNIATDLQEIVRVAKAQLDEPMNPFFRNCASDPET